MPLLDHFSPPLLHRRSWESFLLHWTCQLSGQLNLMPLPLEYLAEGFARRSVTLEYEEVEAPWEPPPILLFDGDLTDLYVFEIRVHDLTKARRLVAVVEVVCPANKEKPKFRRAFLDKCASYLREGISVIVVDIVTTFSNNFHRELLRLLGASDAAVDARDGGLYAAAYRVRTIEHRPLFEVWYTDLTLGQPLPKKPLWLAENLAVPLDLEAAYVQACRNAAIV